MIKEGIRSAAGKYTALIHGNDWVDTEQFAELIERLQKEEADVVFAEALMQIMKKVFWKK